MQMMIYVLTKKSHICKVSKKVLKDDIKEALGLQNAFETFNAKYLISTFLYSIRNVINICKFIVPCN